MDVPGERTIRVDDALGVEVQESFLAFLDSFKSSEHDSIERFARTPPGTKDYVEQLEMMRQHDRTTIYVDFSHIELTNDDLAAAIQQHYFRLDPYLRKAAHQFVKKYHPDYLRANPGGDDDSRRTAKEVEGQENKTFWWRYKIRNLNSAKIGTLLSVSGTVTRTSEVRPELLLGNFRCMDCNVAAPHIEQQFKYTEPPKCKSTTCMNFSRWQLDVSSSIFVDWQKVRAQEHANEIPSGCMPRTLEVILRHDAVEKARAGDKCVFTGTLIAVPDVSKMRIGSNTSLVRDKSGGGGGEGGPRRSKEMDNDSGIGGLKSLGVREMSYRLCFLANSVRPVGRKTLINTREEDLDDGADQLTEEELKEVKGMMKQRSLYSKMVSSMAPAVYGHENVKKGVSIN